jgi:hypothetical protein
MLHAKRPWRGKNQIRPRCEKNQSEFLRVAGVLAVQRICLAAKTRRARRNKKWEIENRKLAIGEVPIAPAPSPRMGNFGEKREPRCPVGMLGNPPGLRFIRLPQGAGHQCDLRIARPSGVGADRSPIAGGLQVPGVAGGGVHDVQNLPQPLPQSSAERKGKASRTNTKADPGNRRLNGFGDPLEDLARRDVTACGGHVGLCVSCCRSFFGAAA